MTKNFNVPKVSYPGTSTSVITAGPDQSWLRPGAVKQLNMAIKVAKIQELNFEPFYVDMERRGIELHEYDVGAASVAVEQGDVDAAPVSLLDSIRLEYGFQPVAGFCIAALQGSDSNLLFSSMPIEELAGATIAGDNEDVTAKSLVRILMELKFSGQPGKFGGPDDPHEAVLVTGDQALRRRRGIRGFPYRYDLVKEWQDWTGLPFVFNRWVAQKDLDPKDVAIVEDTLYVGMEDGVDALYHVSEPRDRLMMLPKDIVQYVQGLRFFMGLSERKSVDLYRRYIEQLGLT